MTMNQMYKYQILCRYRTYDIEPQLDGKVLLDYYAGLCPRFQRVYVDNCSIEYQIKISPFKFH